MAAGLKMSLSGFPHQEHFTTMRGADRGNQETTHCKLIFQILWNPICCSSNNDPVIRRELGVALLAVTLDDIKNQLKLSNIALIKQSRLSVMPLTKKEFKIILKMGNTKLPGL